jgi:hypothetical protein
MPDRASIERSILAKGVRVGTHLGEQSPATSVIRLEAGGIAHVSLRCVIEASLEEAQAAFQARRAVEMGIFRTDADATSAGLLDCAAARLSRRVDPVRPQEPRIAATPAAPTNSCETPV